MYSAIYIYKKKKEKKKKRRKKGEKKRSIIYNLYIYLQVHRGPDGFVIASDSESKALVRRSRNERAKGGCLGGVGPPSNGFTATNTIARTARLPATLGHTANLSPFHRVARRRCGIDG